MAYQPRPGTVPFLAIEFMASLPIGTEVTSAEIGSALRLQNYKLNSLAAWLRPARRNGLVSARKIDRRTMYWRLGEEDGAGNLAPYRRQPKAFSPLNVAGPVSSVFALATSGEWSGPWPPLARGQQHAPLGAWGDGT
jgi:hypothetical protein